MRREDEYRYLADSARRRGGEEKSALTEERNGKFWPLPTCNLQINRRRSMTLARITNHRRN